MNVRALLRTAQCSSLISQNGAVLSCRAVLKTARQPPSSPISPKFQPCLLKNGVDDVNQGVLSTHVRHNLRRDQTFEEDREPLVHGVKRTDAPDYARISGRTS